MYTVELEEVLLSDPYTRQQLVGVFAADNLPRAFVRPGILIANTDPRSKPGRHWVAMYIDDKGRGEFFDSFGMAPQVNKHRDFLDRNSFIWTYNTYELQGYTSTVCGEYCVLYLLHKARGLSLQDFLWHYRNCESAYDNDLMTKQYFLNNFKNCLRPKRILCSNQCCCSRIR